MFLVVALIISMTVSAGQVADEYSWSAPAVPVQFQQSALSWKVAVVFTTEGLGDESWNDQVYQALLETQSRWGVDFEYSEPTQISEYEFYLRNFVENASYSESYDLVISIGFDQGEALQSVAGNYPAQCFAIVGSYVDDDTYPNVASLLFDGAEGSALVGAVAGLTTVSGNVGFIGAMDIPLVNGFRDGFRFGANYTNPGVTVSTQYSGSWFDTTAGQVLATGVYAAGNDIIFAAAGRSGLGVFTSAKTLNGTEGYDNPLWVIGSDYGRMKDGCADPDDPVAPTVGLTSMISNATPGVVSIISHVLNGTFTGGSKSLNAENGGVHIELQPDLLELPQNVLNEVEDMRKGIANGSIVVPGSMGGVTLTERDVPSPPSTTTATTTAPATGTTGTTLPEVLGFFSLIITLGSATVIVIFMILTLRIRARSASDH